MVLLISASEQSIAEIIAKSMLMVGLLGLNPNDAIAIHLSSFAHMLWI